jgi:hypothetical protein
VRDGGQLAKPRVDTAAPEVDHGTVGLDRTSSPRPAAEPAVGARSLVQSRNRLGVAASLAVSLAGAALAPAASAGYVSALEEHDPFEPPRISVVYADSSHYYPDLEGERNTVEIFAENGKLVVRDVVAGVQGADCEQNGPSEQLCPVPDRLDVRLGHGNDTLAVANVGYGPVFALGGEGDDSLSMGGTRSYIIGGPGADTITGGPGRQLVSYDDKTAPVEVDLTRTGAQGTTGENDELDGIEDVLGGYGNDRLTGDGGDNDLAGGFGEDQVLGGEGDDELSSSVSGDGADDLEGGGGEDTLDYSARNTPVAVDLRQPAGQGAAGEDDSIAGIENVRGTQVADVLIGDAGPNTLDGGTGGDSLQGGGGNDRLLPGYSPHNPSWGGGHISDDDGPDESDGGTGVDAVDYGGRVYGVTIDLSTVPGQGQSGEGDRILAVEHAFGGAGSDRLRGDEGQNILDGREGDDTIESRDRTADSVRCGGGPDTAYVDTLDEFSECEVVDRRGPPEPVQPQFEIPTGPSLVFSTSNRRVRATRRGVVAFVVGPFEEDIAGSMTLRPRRPFVARRKLRVLRLGTKEFVGVPESRTVVRMRLSRRSLTRLKRVRKMRAVAKVTLRNGAGNVTSGSYPVTLIAPRRR